MGDKFKDIMNKVYENVTVNGSHGLYIGDAEYVLKLEQQLKEAESVIDFYADNTSWYAEKDWAEKIGTGKIDDIKCTTNFDEGKRAREYRNKYKSVATNYS